MNLIPNIVASIPVKTAKDGLACSVFPNGSPQATPRASRFTK